MDLLRLFADNLLPVLLVAGLGWLISDRLGVPARPLARVALDVLAPALILDIGLTSPLPAGEVARLTGYAFATLALPALVAFAVARWRRWPRTVVSAVVLTVLCTNAGNYGLSVNLLAFGERGMAPASMYFLASSIVSYTAGVFVASMGRMTLRAALVGLVRVPTVWAVSLAFAVRGAGLALPGPVASSVHLLATACIPLFLLVLGMQVHGAKLGGPAGPLVFAASLRLAGGMAVGILLAPAFGLTGLARQTSILESAMPAAVVSTLLAAQYDVEPSLVASIVLLSTLVSPLTLTPLLGWLR